MQTSVSPYICSILGAVPKTKLPVTFITNNKVTYFIYGPRFFPFAASIVLSTSLFTAAIACEDKLADSEPFGSGSPSRGLK